MAIIKQENTSSGGEFIANENGENAGLLVYNWQSASIFSIDHTEVNPHFNGKGIGKQLVLAAIQYARDNGFKIIPYCNFAKAIFEKDVTLQDALAEGF